MAQPLNNQTAAALIRRLQAIKNQKTIAANARDRNVKPETGVRQASNALITPKLAIQIEKNARLQKEITNILKERQLGIARPSTVPKLTGLSKSETKRVQTKQPLTIKKTDPTGPKTTMGPKAPTGGRARVGTTPLREKVNSIPDNRRQDPDGTIAQDRQRARDAEELRLRKEAENSVRNQMRDSRGGSATVQNPKAEPKTREVVDVQAETTGISRANQIAVAKARNRIEASARAARIAARTAASLAQAGHLGGQHAGGHSDVGQSMPASIRQGEGGEGGLIPRMK